jgi:TM2 domain-containing membrane protein YozV
VRLILPRMPAPPPPKAFGIPRRSAVLAGLLGWIVPGLGQAYVGRPAKGLLYLVVIVATYLAGGWLSGWTCVNPDRDPIWFVAQALAGGPTAVTAWLTRGLEAAERLPTYDVGLLYVTVAALLNAVAVSDALGTVNEYRQAYAEAAESWRRAEVEHLARVAAEAAEAAAAAPPASEGGAEPVRLHEDAPPGVEAPRARTPEDSPPVPSAEAPIEGPPAGEAPTSEPPEAAP